jgi:hypothetical protein
MTKKICATGNFYSPVSREEWEANLEQNIKDGLAKPGETYEHYLSTLLHHTYGKPPSSGPRSVPREVLDEARQLLAEAVAAYSTKK